MTQPKIKLTGSQARMFKSIIRESSIKRSLNFMIHRDQTEGFEFYPTSTFEGEDVIVVTQPKGDEHTAKVRFIWDETEDVSKIRVFMDNELSRIGLAMHPSGLCSFFVDVDMDIIESKSFYLTRDQYYAFSYFELERQSITLVVNGKKLRITVFNLMSFTGLVECR